MRKSIDRGMKGVLVGLGVRRAVRDVVLTAAGLIALGAAMGAGVGLMLAPSSGRRLRQDVGERLDVIRNRIKREARRHAHDARAIIG
jgi:hypothetical protein